MGCPQPEEQFSTSAMYIDVNDNNEKGFQDGPYVAQGVPVNERSNAAPNVSTWQRQYGNLPPPGGYYDAQGLFHPYPSSTHGYGYAVLRRRLRTEAYACGCLLCLFCWPLFWVPCVIPACYEDVRVYKEFFVLSLFYSFLKALMVPDDSAGVGVAR